MGIQHTDCYVFTVQHHQLHDRDGENSLTVFPVSSGDLDGADNWEWNHDPGTPGSSSGSSLYPVTSPSLDNAARGFFVTYSDHGGEIYHLSFAKDTDGLQFCL